MRTAYRQHCLALLRKGGWFSSITQELQELILDHSALRKVKTGQVIFSEDTRPIGLFAVLEGQAAITRQIGANRVFFYHLGGRGSGSGKVVC